MALEMQHQIMGYDRAATLFSPEGRLLQVEYAEKTVRLGSASIGVVCSDGALIVTDKRYVDPLLDPEFSVKIYQIDDHIIASAAGVLSDARVLIERAQIFAQQHKITYEEPIDVESIMKEIANIKQAYTQYGGVRPFGTKVMVAGINPDGTIKLFVSEVTGNYFSYKATAIGENDEKIIEMLRESYKENITIDQGIKMALSIFKKILGKNFNPVRFDACYVPKADPKAKRLSQEQLSKYVK
ncbi:MAG: archaeal proteasome endopeptidase complex subunit alpha [Candidatus Pacearchaeota archaeon]|nr:archaeal proteasome endopeptidase complex subunit alpha [Candidatus Pacearchaeota archaeon]